MKICKLIQYSLWGIVLPLCVKAQNTPRLTIDEKKTEVVYQKNAPQDIIVSVANTVPTDSTTDSYYYINVAKIGISKASYSITPNPQKITFGKNMPVKRDIKVTLHADTTDTIPTIFKITLSQQLNSKPLDSCLVIYQPSPRAPTTVEAKLLKSNADIQADLSTLRAQILNGDTTQTYIGKLIIQKNASAVLPGSDEVKSKSLLDRLRKASQTTSNNLTTNVTINTDATTKDMIVNKTVTTKKTTHQLPRKRVPAPIKQKPLNTASSPKLSILLS